MENEEIKQLADQLADQLEAILWVHSKGADLSKVLQESVSLVDQYRKKTCSILSLSLRSAYDRKLLEGLSAKDYLPISEYLSRYENSSDPKNATDGQNMQSEGESC